MLLLLLNMEETESEEVRWVNIESFLQREINFLGFAFLDY